VQLGRGQLIRINHPAPFLDNAAFDRTVTTDQIGGLHVGFPGQWHDPETGHWYNIHRNYDARTGRYLESDPIGLAGGINPYVYASGAPASNVDPWGLCMGEFGSAWFGSDRFSSINPYSLNPNQLVSEVSQEAVSAAAQAANETAGSVAQAARCAGEEVAKEVRNEVIERGVVGAATRLLPPQIGVTATLLYTAWDRSVYVRSYEAWGTGSSIGACMAISTGH